MRADRRRNRFVFITQSGVYVKRLDLVNGRQRRPAGGGEAVDQPKRSPRDISLSNRFSHTNAAERRK